MKKRLHALVLNKRKIVKLSQVTTIFGGTNLESDPNNPDATCDVTSINDPTSDMTDDKSNTDNYIPSKSCTYC